MQEKQVRRAVQHDQSQVRASRINQVCDEPRNKNSLDLKQQQQNWRDVSFDYLGRSENEKI